jgi:very-short-patch-repair endonuclease
VGGTLPKIKVKIMNHELVKRARQMRKEPTPEENKMWHILLKNFKPRFFRQRIIGNYIVDFYCPSLKLIIEIDGSQHNLPENQRYDQKRTKFLENSGYKILRFTNDDINKRIRNVEHTLFAICSERATELALNIQITFTK